MCLSQWGHLVSECAHSSRDSSWSQDQELVGDMRTNNRREISLYRLLLPAPGLKKMGYKNIPDVLAFSTCFTCAAHGGSLLCCWRQADEGKRLLNGTQGRVLGGVRPQAVEGSVHVPVPPTSCCRRLLGKDDLLKRLVPNTIHPLPLWHRAPH